jgi:diacylglycerol kinase (ATP)
MPEYLTLLQRHLGDFEHGVTAGPGDEAVMADRALAEGYDLIIAVGGDGTWSHVADRIVASGRQDVRFGILPAGTGNDFGKGFGVASGDPEDAVRACASGHELRVDMGELRIQREGTGPDSLEEPPRHFTLLVGFGIDVAIIESVRQARFIRGPLVYQAAAIRNLFTYRSQSMRYSDGVDFEGEDAHLLLAICNGPIVGGGFHIAPGASFTDGLLDVRAVRDAGPLGRAGALYRVERGRGDSSPLVRAAAVTEFTVRFDTPAPFQVDGELQPERILRADIRVLPGALRVATPDT